LDAGEAGGRGNHAVQRFVVGFVRGGASGPAIENGAHRNVQVLLGDVLMNRVVGEARERIGYRADFDFGFIGAAQLQDTFGNTVQLGGAKTVIGRRASADNTLALRMSGRFLRRFFARGWHGSISKMRPRS